MLTRTQTINRVLANRVLAKC